MENMHKKLVLISSCSWMIHFFLFQVSLSPLVTTSFMIAFTSKRSCLIFITDVVYAMCDHLMQWNLRRISGCIHSCLVVYSAINLLWFRRCSVSIGIILHSWNPPSCNGCSIFFVGCFFECPSILSFFSMKSGL